MNEHILGVLVWPGVALILGLVGLALFKSQLRQLLGRAQSLGKGWLVATPASQQLSGAIQTSEALEFLDSFAGELIRVQEKAIRDDMAARKLDGAGDAEKVLMRALAATQIALHFEQIQGVIWDGQIQLLETLNTVPEGIELTSIESVYEQEFRAKRSFYDEIEFDAYVGWLDDKTLTRFDGKLIALTVLGREYLKWMVDNGKGKRGVG